MKTKLLFSTLAFLFTLCLSAQHQTNVGVNNEHYHDLNQDPLNDGSDDIMVAANLFDASMTTQVFTLKRVSQTGNVVWARKYDGGALPNARVFDIVNRFDITYVTGSVDVGGTKRTFIAEIEANTGNVLNVQYYDIVSPNFNSRGLNIQYTESDVDGDAIGDPGFVVGGFFSGCYNVDTNCANNIGFVLRTDVNLNILWSLELDTSVSATADYDFINGITETSDGFFITGSATGLNSSNQTQQAVLAHKVDFQGSWMWDQSYIFGNSRDVSVDAYFDAADGRIYMLANYSVSHFFGVTVFDNATGNVDAARSWYANGNEYDKYAFNIMESLVSPNNLVITGYDRDENWIDNAGVAQFGTSNIFVYEFEKATGNAVGPNYQFLVPHVEPTGDEFNFWNGQMPLIYYPDMSFTGRNSTGSVNDYFHVGYRRNDSADFTKAELYKTGTDKRNVCENAPLTISHTPVNRLLVQVFSGSTPSNATPFNLNVSGFNFTENDCTGSLSNGDVQINTGVIFPNPVSDVLYTTVQNAVSYTLMDSLGRVVANGNFNSDKSIQVDQLTNGLYFLNIMDDNRQAQTFKFIKK